MLASKTLDIFSRTIYGEARGESFDGKLAVAYTIVNRASHPGWWGKSIDEVCLAPWQYSCWLSADPNFDKLQHATVEDPAFRQCYAIACLVMDKVLPDPTAGATHYYAASMAKPPAWATTLQAKGSIGQHRFFYEPVKELQV